MITGGGGKRGRPASKPSGIGVLGAVGGVSPLRVENGQSHSCHLAPDVEQVWTPSTEARTPAPACHHFTSTSMLGPQKHRCVEPGSQTRSSHEISVRLIARSHVAHALTEGLKLADRLRIASGYRGWDLR